jgi:hypothetical protein
MDEIEKAIEGHREEEEEEEEEEVGFILVCIKPLKEAEKGMATIFVSLWKFGGLGPKKLSSST